MIEDFADALIRLGRHVGGFERESVCCGTVTLSQCVVLQHLAREPSDMSGLADLAGITVSAMTRLVDSLDDNGWIERRRDSNDRRKVIVGVTEAGKAEAARLRELTTAGVRGVLAHIPGDKHAQVLESLRLVVTAMERAGQPGCCANEAPRGPTASG